MFHLKKIGRRGRRGTPLAEGQRGSLLAEILVGVGAFALLGTAILGAVSSSYIGRRVFDQRSVAENLVRNQLEYVYEQAYIPPEDTYATIAVPDGYAITAEALDYNGDPDVQIVRVTVTQSGAEVEVFETIRSNR